MITSFPSVKTLTGIRGVTPEKARAIRAILQNRSRISLEDSYKAVVGVYPSSNDTLQEVKLDLIDALRLVPSSTGVEYLRTNKRSVWYLNLGDTYDTTLMFHTGRYRVGSWGDVVEKDDY